MIRVSLKVNRKKTPSMLFDAPAKSGKHKCARIQPFLSARG